MFWNHILCLCFGKLTFRESLRYLTSTLNALDSRLFHMGIKYKVRLATFSDANNTRPWQIYQDLAMGLIDQARRIVREQSSVQQTADSIYALDSTTIDLCLSLFGWAEFRRQKAAIKLHTLMDLEGSIATFIHISDGRTPDVTILNMIPITPVSINIIDLVYLYFMILYDLYSEVV